MPYCTHCGQATIDVTALDDTKIKISHAFTVGEAASISMVQQAFRPDSFPTACSTPAALAPADKAVPLPDPPTADPTLQALIRAEVAAQMQAHFVQVAQLVSRSLLYGSEL